MRDAVWIWGRHPVLEALRAGSAHEVLIASGRPSSSVLNEIEREAERRGTPIRVVEYGEIECLAPGQNTQGVAATIEPKRTVPLAELLDDVASSAAPAFLIVLDQIQDPHNVGAILRTAEAAGVHGVVIPGRRSAALDGIVAKTSAGALHLLKIALVTNLARALDEIRERGIWTAGLDGTAQLSLFRADLTLPIALVLGSEGAGLRRLTREHCDLLLRVPVLGQTESLNVSVAAGVAMYEAVRQREAHQ